MCCSPSGTWYVLSGLPLVLLAFTTLIVQSIDSSTYNLSTAFTSRDVTTLGSPEIRLLHSPGFELQPPEK